MAPKELIVNSLWWWWLHRGLNCRHSMGQLGKTWLPICNKWSLPPPQPPLPPSHVQSHSCTAVWTNFLNGGSQWAPKFEREVRVAADQWSVLVATIGEKKHTHGI